jgi:hypothetical protein
MMDLLRVLSLGAGVQSTTLALMAAHGELDAMPDCAIFADTGAEPTRVYEHLRWLMSDNVLPFPVHVISAGSLLEALYDPRGGVQSGGGRPPFFAINDDGGPGPLKRQCTRHYKVDPIRKKVRELMGLRKGQRGPRIPVVEQWIGISLDEAIRMKPSRDAYIANRWPLVEKQMRRYDCLNWLERNGYPKPPKSACTFCPYRDSAGWRDMRDNDPASWRQAVEVDRHIRHNMPRVSKSQVFVHRSLKPLDEVDLSTSEERGQLNLFLNDCEGMCGV